jgi:hypothetical protein
MSHADTDLRVAGSWLAIASLLLAGALATHGPLAHDLSEQMKVIATGPTRWSVVHWVAAMALSLFVVASLIVLTARSRLTTDWWTMSAWAILPVGALWTLTTAVAENSVIAHAAKANDTAMFEAWWAFAEAKGAGFTFVALALAVIAANESRSPQRVTPVWASSIAAIAGVASFVGWAVGIWLGIRIGNLLWVVSSFVMCLWTLWFGVALMRKGRVATPR